MWDAALIALERFADPLHLGMLMAGVLAGTVIGILPGLGGIACVAILLPFIYTLDVHTAMILLVGSLAVVHTSDTITSVLIGTPGSAAAAATILDGHPLAKQGEAARALSAAFLSSMIGGLIGTVFLTLSLPIARPLVLLFGSPELLMLCVLGLSFAGFLTGGAPLKGGLAACLGLLLGSVGSAPADAVNRYTFGQLYLLDGIPLVGVALGIFGIAEIIDLLAKGGQIAERIPLGHGWLQGARDVWQHWGIVVRGSLIGVWAGILPGIGATAGSWMSLWARGRHGPRPRKIRQGRYSRRHRPGERQQFRRGRGFHSDAAVQRSGRRSVRDPAGRVVFLRHSARPAHGAGKPRSDFHNHLEFCHRQYGRRRAVFSLEPGAGAAHLGSLRSAGSGRRRHDFFRRLSELRAVRRYLRHARVGIARLAHETVGMAARAFSRRLRLDQADRTVSMAIDRPLRLRVAAASRES